MLTNDALIIGADKSCINTNVNMQMNSKYLLTIFTSSSTEASSIIGLKGEPPPLLTPSTISATETKRVASYQSSQGYVKESLRGEEKKKNKKKGKHVENTPPVGRKNIDCNARLL